MCLRRRMDFTTALLLFSCICQITFALNTLPSSNVQPDRNTKLFGCAINQYNGVLYLKDNLLNENEFLVAETFEKCVETCLQYKTPCKSINFLSAQKLCGMHGSSMNSSQNSDGIDYYNVPESVYASLNCDSLFKPSGPVYCGRQAPQYQPFIPRQRIIGGTEARPHSWPWQVTITVDFRNGFAANCGGSLIRIRNNVQESDIVVTAAHCVTKEESQSQTPVAYSPDQFDIVSGNHRRDKYEPGEQRRTGARVVFHRKFQFTPTTGANNDIALIKLDQPIKFTDTTRPICLPGANEPIPLGKVCITTGWGRDDSHNSEVAQALQQLLAPVRSTETCKNGWGSLFMENQMLCAGSLRGDSGTCQGDSGGMLACQNRDGSWTLHGATSFGVSDTCLEAEKPGIFTRISSYIDWINKNAQRMTSL